MTARYGKLPSNIRVGFFVVCFWIGDFASLCAQVTTYADPVVWNAAVYGATTVTVPDYVVPDLPDGDPAYDDAYIYGGPPASVTYGTITFSTEPGLGNGNLLTIGSQYFLALRNHLISPVLQTGYGNSGAEDLVISFPSPVTAFGIQYGDFNGDVIDFYLGTAGSSFQSPADLADDTALFTAQNPGTLNWSDISTAYNTPDFFGLTSSTPFTSVLVLSPSSDTLDVTDVSYSVNVVPEPDALVLLIFSGFAFALHRWQTKT